MSPSWLCLGMVLGRVVVAFFKLSSSSVSFCLVGLAVLGGCGLRLDFYFLEHLHPVPRLISQLCFLLARASLGCPCHDFCFPVLSLGRCLASTFCFPLAFGSGLGLTCFAFLCACLFLETCLCMVLPCPGRPLVLLLLSPVSG